MALQFQFLESFECLGDACEDTCCKGWGMQVDAATVERYQQRAPELMEVVTSGEAEYIMKRDPETDYCVKFDAGWCGIHKEKGTEFLGDACHFFPRVTRGLGDEVVQTASLSCPEVVRLVQRTANPFALVEMTDARLPHSLRHYKPDALDDASALALHEFFVNKVVDEGATPEEYITQLHVTVQSMQRVDVASWPAAAPFYMQHAPDQVQVAEKAPADMFNLLHALVGLVGAARPAKRLRLQQVLDAMTQAMDVTFDAERQMQLGAQSAAGLQAIQSGWQAIQPQWEQWLRRWVQAQLSVACFPFAGFGESLENRVVILAVRFATLKLALACWYVQKGSLEQSDALLITQSLARFLDHLADPSLSMAIYGETGWVRNGRLRGLLAGV